MCRARVVQSKLLKMILNVIFFKKQKTRTKQNVSEFDKLTSLFFLIVIITQLDQMIEARVLPEEHQLVRLVREFQFIQF